MARHIGYVLYAFFVAAVAAPAASGAFTVDLEEPRVRLVERSELRVQCRTDKNIDGCAEFLGEVLRAQCEKNDKVWRINATARIIPYLYVTSPSVVAHEQLHLDDISRQLQQFLATLTTRSFEDEAVCRADAEFETAVFALRMDVFRVESNERLH